MQELTIRETRTVGQWTLDITRDEKDGRIVGYIVAASNGLLLTTLETFGVGGRRGLSAAGAFATALRYLGIVEEGVARTGELPCHRPRPRDYYL